MICPMVWRWRLAIATFMVVTGNFLVASQAFADKALDDLCAASFSREDAAELLKTPTQKAAYEAIIANDTPAALRVLPLLGDVNFITPDITPILSWAVSNRNFELVSRLLEAGADPNRTDCLGWPPLMFLANDSRVPGVESATRELKIADLLLAHGAKLTEKNGPRWNNHPLALAARTGNVEIIRWLVTHGVPVNQEYDGFTPLMQTALFNKIEAAKTLLSAGADVNAGDPKLKLNSALMLAIDTGDPAFVKLLIAHGANVNERRSLGSPLEHARGLRFLKSHESAVQHQRDDEIIESLISAGAKE
jgi:ankyrin repeat protein